MTTSTDFNNPSSRGVKKHLTIVYFAAFIALGLYASVLGPTLLSLAENTRTHLGDIGFLFMARSLGYLLGSLLSGRAFDRLPGHALLASMLLGMAATSLLTPMISKLWLLTAILLIMGITEGALDIGSNLLLVWVHRHRAGPYLNALHFFFGLGAFLSPILVAQSILRGGGITWAYWGLALYPLPLAVWVLRLPSPQSLERTPEGTQAQIHFPLVALLAVFFFLYVGAEASFGGWIYTYTTSLELGDATSAAYLTSAFWGALTAGRLLGIPIAARFPPRPIIFIDLVGCLVSLGAIVLFPGIYSMVWLGAIGLGLFMASIYPNVLAFAQRRMKLTGEATRWFFVGTGAGGMFLPWLVGNLFEHIGPRAIMFAILIDLILGLVVFLFSNLLTERSLSSGSSP
jgi:FHS family Na+ dependent glucose MFS transporter 1